MKKIYIYILIIITSILTIGSSATFSQIENVQKYEFKNLPKINKEITLGGFSDLFFKDGYLYTITDRGPVSKKIKKDEKKYKIFFCDSYKPKILKLKIENNELNIVSINDIKNVSALPIAEKRDFIPLNTKGKLLNFDINGLDSESLIIDNEGNYWIGDEYYPSILKVDKNFNVVKRFAPINCKYKNPQISYILPEEFNNIKKNKGFEAIAYDGNDTIYVFTQSTLKDKDYIAVTKFDIKAEKSTNLLKFKPKENEKINGATFINNDTILTIGKIKDEPHLNILKIKKDLLVSKKSILLSKVLKLTTKTNFEGISYDNTTKTFYLINDNNFGLNSDKENKSYILKMNLKKNIDD